MARITLEAKEAIVEKALSSNGIPLQQIAKDSGVGYSTLQKWLRLKREGFPLARQKCHEPPEIHTTALQHILATEKLDEDAIGAYCRAQGIHSFQLVKWRSELMAYKTKENQSNNSRDELKALRQENKKLKKDLNRKDKALAETSALLILKKKADLIWGDYEDD